MNDCKTDILNNRMTLKPLNLQKDKFDHRHFVVYCATIKPNKACKYPGNIISLGCK